MNKNTSMPSHISGSMNEHMSRYDTVMQDIAPSTAFSTLSNYGMHQSDAESISSWRESLIMVQQYVSFSRRKVRANDRVYLCGESFKKLYLISAGLFKIVNLTSDGREQPAGLYFKGDWLGFDGIPTGQYGCSAIALDCGEVWTINYDSLLQASIKEPKLMRVVFAAMSVQLAHNRDAMLSMGTLPADARVCDFLLQWAHSLAERGLRTDQFNVYLTRADIGHYLGLRLESVSRALSKLARYGIIQFNEKGRREISIPDLDALTEFIQNDSERSASAPVLQ
ncbi:MAG: Crp/Fnr family transcriptional regulator [Undibacterium sp.]|nr:Crp/Fnr family transcriptional regulator [Undibacterium sp.]MDO9191969.1 Crp/Fnr family transcriptional regulator [Undibacterium sp.]